MSDNEITQLDKGDDMNENEKLASGVHRKCFNLHQKKVRVPPHCQMSFLLAAVHKFMEDRRNIVKKFHQIHYLLHVCRTAF